MNKIPLLWHNCLAFRDIGWVATTFLFFVGFFFKFNLMRRGKQRDVCPFTTFCTMLKNKAAGFNFQTFCAFWLCNEGEGETKSVLHFWTNLNLMDKSWRYLIKTSCCWDRITLPSTRLAELGWLVPQIHWFWAVESIYLWLMWKLIFSLQQYDNSSKIKQRWKQRKKHRGKSVEVELEPTDVI